MVKCLRLAQECFNHIRKEEWDKALDICEELLSVLKTYNDAC
jgi:hypothetical protein